MEDTKQQPQDQQEVKQKVATEQPKPKKPYSTPTLTRYGGLPEITEMVGKTGATDSGTGNAKNTKP